MPAQESVVPPRSHRLPRRAGQKPIRAQRADIIRRMRRAPFWVQTVRSVRHGPRRLRRRWSARRPEPTTPSAFCAALRSACSRVFRAPRRRSRGPLSRMRMRAPSSAMKVSVTRTVLPSGSEYFTALSIRLRNAPFRAAPDRRRAGKAARGTLWRRRQCDVSEAPRRGACFRPRRPPARTEVHPFAHLLVPPQPHHRMIQQLPGGAGGGVDGR